MKDELEKPVEKLTSGWQPIVQKTEQVKIVENIIAKPRAGLMSLTEIQTELQPSKKEPVNELVHTFTAQIEEQEKNRVSKPTKPIVETIAEAKIETAPEPIKEETLIDKASAYIKSQTKNEDSYQQPVVVTPANFSEVARKVKFLEEWLGKVSISGPGSGEVKFLRLDDVNYQSWQNRDRHKIVKFEPNINPAYDGVTFGFLTGDQGEIYSLKYDPYTGYTGNANVAAGLTYYDPKRDTLEILHKDSSATYVGLDNYIRFKNGTANTITRGTVVSFIGSDLTDNVPVGGLYLSNTTSNPLYFLGVSTTDCAPYTLGRAMLLGELENINASGSTSGETWSIGDLLWASPSVPGKLTKVKPTAPDVSLSVAAVMNNSATSGILLVRPTIWPRLRAGDFYSNTGQTAALTNTGYRVGINNTLFESGVKLTDNVITVTESGLYKFEVRTQVTSTSANQKSIALWFKKNNVNIPYSTVRQSVATNGGYATVTNNQIISLTPSDNVTVFYAVTDTSLFIDIPGIIDGSANIPAVQLTVTEPSL